MELMLEIISRQKFAGGFPTSHVFGEVGGVIGRSQECEWRLPDKAKQISRKHAVISCDGRSFFLEDISSNGVHASLDRRPLGKGSPHKIDHGDSFTIGEFAIQARLLHKPDAYLQSGVELTADIIPEDISLDLDPLVAMEQQDSHEAKRRLGLYTDLLGETPPPLVQPADHSEPRMDMMPRVSAIPENWHDAAERAKAQRMAELTIGQPVAAAQPYSGAQPVPAAHQFPEVQVFSAMQPPSVANPYATAQPFPIAPPPVPPVESAPPTREVVSVPETDVFFKTLGFATPPESPEERERILRQAAELLVASVDGMVESLHNRAESKNELRLPVTTMRLAGNNPLKYSPTARAALDDLLAPPQNGVLPPAKAMYSGFDDLHGHHMGLLAGARAAVRGALDKVSPQNVEARLDVNGPVRLNRTARLWHTFIRMHQALHDDHDGFAALFLHDFARAYEVQVRTLHPLAERTFKGE